MELLHAAQTKIHVTFDLWASRSMECFAGNYILPILASEMSYSPKNTRIDPHYPKKLICPTACPAFY
jgi:hypothetical protein